MKRLKSYITLLMLVVLFGSGMAFNANAQEKPSNITVTVKENDPNGEFGMQELVPYTISVKALGRVNPGETLTIYFDDTISFLEISDRVIRMKQDNGISLDIAKIEYEDNIRDYLGDVFESSPKAKITFLPGIENFDSPYFVFNGYVRSSRGNEPNTNIVANAYLDEDKTENIGSVKYKYSLSPLSSTRQNIYTSWLSRDDYNFYMVLNQRQVEGGFNIINFDISAMPYAPDPFPPYQMNGYFNQIDFKENENPLEFQEFVIYKNSKVDEYGRIIELGEIATTHDIKITDDKTQSKPSAPTRSGLVINDVDATYLIFLKATINPLFEPEPDFDGVYWIHTKAVYNIEANSGIYPKALAQAGFYYNPFSQSSGYAEVEVSKDADKEKVYVGEELTYSIIVDNISDTSWTGTVNDLINLDLVDLVPNSTTLNGEVINDELHWKNGLLSIDLLVDSSKTATIEFKVIPKESAVESGVSNSATVSSPDNPDTIITPPKTVEILPTIDIEVNKVWMGNPKVTPNIEVQLYRDNQPYGESIELTPEMDWKYKWTDLPKVNLEGIEYLYTVDEITVPNGFTKTVDGFTITNTFKENEVPEGPDTPEGPNNKEDLPNTGFDDQNQLYAIIAILGGILVILKNKEKAL